MKYLARLLGDVEPGPYNFPGGGGDYPTLDEISDQIIQPDFWVMPCWVLSPFFGGADYSALDEISGQIIQPGF
jgi:hypothetical protein